MLKEEKEALQELKNQILLLSSSSEDLSSEEKEELQRYGDELDGKVKKCEKEIKALLNTLDHLKVRNKNYRDKFL